MKLPQLAIRNFQFTLVFTVLLVLVGTFSFVTMPRAEDPLFEFPAAWVVSVYPGATPEDIESLVVNPIEEEINELENLRRVETIIRDGTSSTVIEFISGTDPDAAYENVVEAVNKVKNDLPDEVLYVEAIQPSPSEVTILQLALVSESASYRVLQREAELLEKHIERVNGIKRADVLAFPESIVEVGIDMEKMGEWNISLNQVIQSIQSSSQNIPGGDIDIGRRRFNIKTSGHYTSIEDINRTIVAASLNELVYLKDIADVHLDYTEETYRARFMGKRCVFITLLQRRGTNIFRVMDDVRPILNDFEADLPNDVALETVFDQSQSVKTNINGFFSNLLQGMLLVAAVIVLFLGFRASSIVITAIPISILIAIVCIDLAGYAFQQISIAGLVIALGLLVDNAIVVTENAERYLLSGLSGTEAAIKGTNEVGWAITSATATTILAFVPMVVVRTTSGDFVRSLPVTVIFTLAASLAVSLMLTPFLASRLLRVKSGDSRGQKPVGFLYHGLKRLVDGPYRSTLSFCLRRPVLVSVLAGGALAGSLMLFPVVGVSLFPKAEKPQFIINIETPEGSSLDFTDEIALRIEGVLSDRPEIRHYASNVGRGNPRVYYNVFPKQEKSTVGQILVELYDYRDAPRVIPELESIFSQYPGVNIDFIEFEHGPPVEAPIEIKVIGPELDVLRRLADDTEQILLDAPGTTSINNPLSTPKTDLHVRVNREKAGLLGIPLVEIDRTVRAGMTGLPVASYHGMEGEELDIVVRLPQSEKPVVSDFDRILVSSLMGVSIPWHQVVSLSLETGPKRIDHYNMERTTTITSDVEEGYSEFTVTADVVERLEAYDWPTGYHYFVGGKLEEQQEGFAGLTRALIIALLSILAILVLQFRSFSQPLIIFVAIPLALIGAVLGLFFSGYTFSFVAFIGLTSLVGIVVNNAIILVDYANRLAAQGKTIIEAVTESAVIRFIPILLTTLTTIGGLLPLTLTGSSMWSPLGWVIIGGLSVSTMLTLLFVPVLYTFFTRKTEYQ